MKIVNIGLIENSNDNSKSFEKLVKNHFPFLNIKIKCKNTHSLLNSNLLEKIDVLFLHIECINLEVIKKIQAKKSNVLFVTVIEKEEDAILAYKFNVLDCFELPYTLEKISVVMNKINIKLFIR